MCDSVKLTGYKKFDLDIPFHDYVKVPECQEKENKSSMLSRLGNSLRESVRRSVRGIPPSFRRSTRQPTKKAETPKEAQRVFDPLRPLRRSKRKLTNKEKPDEPKTISGPLNVVVYHVVGEVKQPEEPEENGEDEED